jgi:hypothetical protein
MILKPIVKVNSRPVKELQQLDVESTNGGKTSFYWRFAHE